MRQYRYESGQSEGASTLFVEPLAHNDIAKTYSLESQFAFTCYRGKI